MEGIRDHRKRHEIWNSSITFFERYRRQMILTVRNDLLSNDRSYGLTSAEMGQTFARERSFSNELHRQNLKSRSPCMTPLLKKTDLESRLKFANTHLSKDDGFFRHILWSDECKIVLFGRSCLAKKTVLHMT